MLTEERLQGIWRIVTEKGSASIQELMDALDISESTVRRDLAILDEQGRIQKVRGGAMVAGDAYSTKEDSVIQKKDKNLVEKREIAKYAASLIQEDDFVYLDAGTTTGYMLEHLEGSGATFVTNGVSHARTLAQMGVRVLLIGGELKGSTEAVIGSQAMQMLKNYHFTKGFFGTNGMTQREGFTTPESNEALVKRTAMEQCLERYVVSDSSKFGQISAVTFFSFDGAVILTESCSKEYKDCRNIQIVS